MAPMPHQEKKKQKKQCFFCRNSKDVLDYKDTDTLSRYVSSFAKIVPRKRSGVCAWHQRALSLAIKRARFMGLLPFVER
jgi:small subunit ribosomal protein S18